MKVKKMENAELDETPERELSELIKHMLTVVAEEREKSAPYQELFKSGNSLDSLLRELDRQCARHILDAFRVLMKKFGVSSKNDDAFRFLYAVPFLRYALEKHILSADGATCCADKTFHLLARELERLCSAERDEEI